MEEPDPPAPLEFLQEVDELMVQFPQSIRDAMLLYTELVFPLYLVFLRLYLD